MPGRSLQSSPQYRFAYQGQFAEKDEETGFTNFELRQFDTKIGRWNTVDPYAQYFNPYLGMGNNPANYIDPDGGYDGWYRDADGNAQFDANVHSQADLAAAGISGTFVGETFSMGNWHGDAQGNLTYNIPFAVEVSAEMSHQQRLQANPVVQPVYQGHENWAPFIEWLIPVPPLLRGVKLLRGLKFANNGCKLAKYSGILRSAAKYKGNFGLGKANNTETMELGKAWVGKGYRVSKSGKAWISKDGLRQFRPPSSKPRLGINQANFQWRNVNRGAWQGNGHLNIN